MLEVRVVSKIQKFRSLSATENWTPLHRYTYVFMIYVTQYTLNCTIYCLHCVFTRESELFSNRKADHSARPNMHLIRSLHYNSANFNCCFPAISDQFISV